MPLLIIGLLLFGIFIYLIVRGGTKNENWESRLWGNEGEERTGKTVIKILRSEYPYPKIKTPEHWEKNITAKRVTKWHNTINSELNKSK